MTFEAYAIAGGVIGAVIGLGSGLAVRRRRASRLLALLLSFAAAFAGISGLVVGYEVLYGEGLLAGLAWMVLYSPVNLCLSGAAPIFCGLGMLLLGQAFIASRPLRRRFRRGTRQAVAGHSTAVRAGAGRTRSTDRSRERRPGRARPRRTSAAPDRAPEPAPVR